MTQPHPPTAEHLSLLHQAIAPLGLSEEQWLPQAQRLYALLLEANQHTNLTRLTQPADYWLRHWGESVWLAGQALAYAHTEAPAENSPWPPPLWADLGTGNGFPLLPAMLTLGQVRPWLGFVGIESVAKKRTCVQTMATELGLADNLHLLGGRAEDIAHHPDTRYRFSGVLARAVAPLPTLLELACPLLHKGGVLLALKGAKAPEEIKAAKKAFHVLNAQLEAVIPLNTWHPESLGQLLVIRQVGLAPQPYPRRAGEPSKSPLK